MGFRFRKSINLGGGVRVNLSKSGIGYSVGTKGYRVTKTAKGTTRTTTSIPGTGLSYVHETSNVKKRPPVVNSEVQTQETSKKKGFLHSARYYKVTAIFCKIAAVIMIAMGLVLTIVNPLYLVACIIIAVIEWKVANKMKKKADAILAPHSRN